ncbi:MAG: UvrB/UvrC motif-containing protein [Nanoarchaeota archaeon]|nr:UvrB/UvrC motif-containing protein [Nanoarchaeota archaeon]MBU1269837.1 UvrB/UvrC motif-containing protein [Nanoarchaeota archaeon]MBU1605145.1 UvrB/UvrC motif-containing protein [Nanoarchaeota archaeon]MBU2442960.1 UvrB/UvrC motif-containing protein [Nanoarchaeota archaeon]
MDYNKQHKITPKTIIKPIRAKEVFVKDTKHIPKSDVPALIVTLEKEMKAAADELDFETAILLRNQLDNLKKRVS